MQLELLKIFKYLNIRIYVLIPVLGSLRHIYPPHSGTAGTAGASCVLCRCHLGDWGLTGGVAGPVPQQHSDQVVAFAGSRASTAFLLKKKIDMIFSLCQEI